MKIEVLKEDLIKAINHALRFVTPRAQLPILGNIVLSSSKTGLNVLATNLETSFVASVGARVKEGGEIAVPAKSFVDVVSNLSPGGIFLEAKKETLEISSGNFRGSILGLNTSDFPRVPTSVGVKGMKLPGSKIKETLFQTLFAVSQDDIRPVLTGVLFWLKNNSLYVVSSDGFRLSRKRIRVSEGGDEMKVILPRAVIQEVFRILDDQDLIFQVSEKDSQVIFGVGDIVLSSRLIEGDFPDFEKIIPTSTRIQIHLNREDFLQAVKLAAVFAREAANTTKVRILPEKVQVLAESQKSGSQKTLVEARVESPAKVLSEGGLEVVYNCRFLEEFLNSVSGEDVQIGLNDATSAGIFLDPSDPDFLHLIMPVKVQG